MTDRVNMHYESENRPADWPVNIREDILDRIWEKLYEFETQPTYKTREVLLALVSEHDFNQSTSVGKVRFTDYETELINCIYHIANHSQLNSVKAYLYDLITEATRLQKWVSWKYLITGEEGKDEAYRIKPYEEGLLLPLKLYHFAYQKYTMEKTQSFAKQIMSVVSSSFENCNCIAESEAIAKAFCAMLHDVSYMRGNKREKIWELNRDELLSLCETEARIFRACKMNPLERPALKIQLSNFILKSRNNYNQDFICKYLTDKAAESSAVNHELWMRQIKDLNDEREQKVVPELFIDESWIEYPWAKEIDFTPIRTYYVSSFSKSINSANMKDEYGSCVYGYKNDRIAELVAPIMMCKFRNGIKTDENLPDELILPVISQVVAFDVIYDRNEAKKELQYLFKIIDLFEMSDGDKHIFLQGILQYWLLSVKDDRWKNERERRYVPFLYDEYDYIEIDFEDGFLKEKTSLFLSPDFLIGNNPKKHVVQRNMEAKQKSLMMREYLHCHDCLMQDYDSIHNGSSSINKCPICGSTNIEIIYPE